MAEVHIVDIDGEQWNMKDLPLTGRVAVLEEEQPIIRGNRFTGVVSTVWSELARVGGLPAGKYILVGNASAAVTLVMQRAGVNLLVTSTYNGANVFYFEIPNDGRVEDVVIIGQSSIQTSFTLGWSIIKVAGN